MTLQQAHEIQRRELVSLRAENARPKKQSSALFPSEFKNNPDIYPTGRAITKQLIDIRVLVSVRDYVADVFRVRDYVADVFRDRKTCARLHAFPYHPASW